MPALPAVHRDTFDRVLIAQARDEGLTFATVGRTLAEHGGPVVTLERGKAHLHSTASGRNKA